MRTVNVELAAATDTCAQAMAGREAESDETPLSFAATRLRRHPDLPRVWVSKNRKHNNAKSHFSNCYAATKTNIATTRP